VLRRGGHIVFNVWDRIEENAFADDGTNAVAALFPHDPPRILARTPHGYHDIALIRKELSRAGFADIKIETRENVSRAPLARDAADRGWPKTAISNAFPTVVAEIAFGEDHHRPPVSRKDIRSASVHP